MKKLFLLAALVANAQAESQMYAVTESCSSEFKQSYGFVELDLGARFGRAKPYLQVTPSGNVFTAQNTPGLTPLNGLPGVSKGYSGFVANLGIGGDYIFQSSCFVLGGYLSYAFSNAAAKFPVLYVDNLTASQSSFSTNQSGLKFNGRGYLSFGTRMGVRCNRHLWVGILGMSFPSFSGSLWSVSGGSFNNKILTFKSKLSPFIQFGAEYSYSLTKSFSMGLSYIFNMGRVRLSNIKVAGAPTTFVTNFQNASTVYRSKRANFSSVMAIFRYMMTASR
jgi:hypothetical protein